jgi:hypothetical protein
VPSKSEAKKRIVIDKFLSCKQQRPFPKPCNPENGPYQRDQLFNEEAIDQPVCPATKEMTEVASLPCPIPFSGEICLSSMDK